MYFGLDTQKHGLMNSNPDQIKIRTHLTSIHRHIHRITSRKRFLGKNDWSNFALTTLLVRQKIIRVYGRYKISLTQPCTTYGPRAKCGPRKLFIWPAKHIILTTYSLKKSIKSVKHVSFGPWTWQLKISSGPPWDLSCAPLVLLTSFICRMLKILLSKLPYRIYFCV